MSVLTSAAALFLSTGLVAAFCLGALASWLMS